MEPVGSLPHLQHPATCPFPNVIWRWNDMIRYIC